MIRTEESRDHDKELKWHQRERDNEPPLEDDTLVPHVKALATWENSPRITGLGDRGQHERTEISTTLELILDRQTATSAEVLRPLLVELPFQVKSPLLVGDVAGSDEEGKGDPQHEGVPGEETAVVEENASPADQGGYDAYSGGNSGNDEFLPVSDSDNVCPIPDKEPRKQAENEGDQGVDCQLQSGSFSDGTEEQSGERSHKDIGNKHDPLELGPSEGGLFRIMPKPCTLHTIVVLIVSAGHAGFISLEGFAATALFAHPCQCFSISSP